MEITSVTSERRPAGASSSFKAIIVAVTSRYPGAAQLLLACALAVIACAACSGATTHVPTNGPADEVTSGQIGGLGSLLVNGSGRTLYLYEPDNRSSHSTCSGPCAIGWPPLLLPKGVTSAQAGPGISASLLGVTTRADGSVQVTYNGWPLYRWANDTGPGQATGQGLYNLGGLWYVVSPNGSPIH